MSSPSNVEFRACVAADAPIASPLILSSGPHVMRYAFSVRHRDEVLEFVDTAFRTGRGELGYRNHVALDVDGRMVGIGAAFRSSDSLAFATAGAAQIARFYGVRRAPGVVLRALRLEGVVRPPRPGATYIGHLGVDPTAQGRGLGSRLLDHFVTLGRQHGSSVCALDVAESNPRARALYERHGFRVVEHRRGGPETEFGRLVSHDYMELALG